MITSQSDADSVIILWLDSQRLSPAKYCFVVTGTDSSFTAVVIGSFTITGTTTLPKIFTIIHNTYFIEKC